MIGQPDREIISSDSGKLIPSKENFSVTIDSVPERRVTLAVSKIPCLFPPPGSNQ
jgi:hypothetical protein